MDIHELAQTQVLAEWEEMERRLRLVIQPRPRWLPERIWRRVVARLLVIESR